MSWRDAPLSLHPLGPAAVRLINRGYRVLLLGGKDGNIPLGALARQPNGYKSATNDLTELEQRLWRAGRAATGLGIVVGGDGPVVIDADGPCAVAWLRELLGDALEHTPRQTTGKGMQLFFKPDPTVRRSMRGIKVRCTCGGGCGINVLASTTHGKPGGYVAIAPSPGETWEWPEGGVPL